MISSKFYYVQTPKVVNSKDVSCKGSNFVHGEEFSPIFQTLIFLSICKINNFPNVSSICSKYYCTQLGCAKISCGEI